MSATTWLIISIVGFSLSGIALVVAVFMFIKLNVPSIIGDLTGKTVAREIKARKIADTTVHTSSVKVSFPQKNTQKVVQKATDTGADTENMSGTAVLDYSLANDSEYGSETIVLGSTREFVMGENVPVRFNITRSVVMVHTDEEI